MSQAVTTIGFGGPIALAGHVQQDLVDERGWVRKEDYLEGLALAQLAPGPLAAQFAIYLGYIRAGVLGATAVGVAFVLPSFSDGERAPFLQRLGHNRRIVLQIYAS